MSDRIVEPVNEETRETVASPEQIDPVDIFKRLVDEPHRVKYPREELSPDRPGGRPHCRKCFPSP